MGIIILVSAVYLLFIFIGEPAKEQYDHRKARKAEDERLENLRAESRTDEPGDSPRYERASDEIKIASRFGEVAKSEEVKRGEISFANVEGGYDVWINDGRRSRGKEFSHASVPTPLVYLIRKKDCYKIGISGESYQRERQWRKAGWAHVMQITTWRVTDAERGPFGHHAVYGLEQQLLDHYRSIGACPHPSPPQMPDGHTETVVADQLSVEDFAQRALNILRSLKEMSPAEIQRAVSKRGRPF
jgi:hypothetical protein